MIVVFVNKTLENHYSFLKVDFDDKKAFNG